MRTARAPAQAEHRHCRSRRVPQRAHATAAPGTAIGTTAAAVRHGRGRSTPQLAPTTAAPSATIGATATAIPAAAATDASLPAASGTDSERWRISGERQRFLQVHSAIIARRNAAIFDHNAWPKMGGGMPRAPREQYE